MQIIIFHGWGASSKDNWFPWLKKDLEKKGQNVICPDLPNSQFPKQEEWIKAALKFNYDENTILVGHSLGSVLIMRILERLQNKIKASFLVAPFDKKLGINEINDFFKSGFNYIKIRSTSKIYLLASDNDPFIPLSIPELMSKKLMCKLIVFNNKEHLSQGTNNFEFPELLEMILKEQK